uniref:Uncharacterized protein n=1 Tax=Arundo donax TaxID=35708 RepID=A0A0A9F684_ARUDO
MPTTPRGPVAAATTRTAAPAAGRARSSGCPRTRPPSLRRASRSTTHSTPSRRRRWRSS